MFVCLCYHFPPPCAPSSSPLSPDQALVDILMFSDAFTLSSLSSRLCMLGLDMCAFGFVRYRGSSDDLFFFSFSNFVFISFFGSFFTFGSKMIATDVYIFARKEEPVGSPLCARHPDWFPLYIFTIPSFCTNCSFTSYKFLGGRLSCLLHHLCGVSDAWENDDCGATTFYSTLQMWRRFFFFLTFHCDLWWFQLFGDEGFVECGQVLHDCVWLGTPPREFALIVDSRNTVMWSSSKFPLLMVPSSKECLILFVWSCSLHFFFLNNFIMISIF